MTNLNSTNSPRDALSTNMAYIFHISQASTELPDFWHECGPSSTQKYDADQSSSDTGDAATDKRDHSYVKGPCGVQRNGGRTKGMESDDEVVPGTEFEEVKVPTRTPMCFRCSTESSIRKDS